LEEHADIGHTFDVLNIKNIIEGNFSIFYEIKTGTIEILTLWDNRQNPENLHLKD